MKYSLTITSEEDDTIDHLRTMISGDILAHAISDFWQNSIRSRYKHGDYGEEATKMISDIRDEFAEAMSDTGVEY